MQQLTLQPPWGRPACSYAGKSAGAPGNAKAEQQLASAASLTSSTSRAVLCWSGELLSACIS
jgi:hypothetical protein